MKGLFKISTIITAIILITGCSSNKDAVKPDYEDFSYAISIQFGEYLKSMEESMFVEIDVDAAAKALKDVLEGTATMDKTMADSYVNDFFTITIPAYMSYNAQQYIDKAAKKSKNQRSESGLVYKIIKKGKDTKPTLNDNVTLKIKCETMNGTVIYGNNNNTMQTLSLSSQVKGISEGLQLIGEGGKIKLWIPYELAFGVDGNEALLVEGYQPLYVEAELIKIN